MKKTLFPLLFLLPLFMSAQTYVPTNSIYIAKIRVLPGIIVGESPTQSKVIRDTKRKVEWLSEEEYQNMVKKYLVNFDSYIRSAKRTYDFPSLFETMKASARLSLSELPKLSLKESIDIRVNTYFQKLNYYPKVTVD